MKSRIIVIACLLLLAASVTGAGERTVIYKNILKTEDAQCEKEMTGVSKIYYNPNTWIPNKPYTICFEYKIVPEADLEKWLNAGWELDKAYSIYEARRNMQGYEIKGDVVPINKAIIKRKVK
jgi:hypothetical protein